MSKDSNTGQRAIRQHLPTKIIVERHYVGAKKLETVFKRIAKKKIIKKLYSQVAKKQTMNAEGNDNLLQAKISKYILAYA